MPRFFAIVLEGLSFLWCFRKATPSYIRWRLGTVYGTFDSETGAERPTRVLISDLWRDRSQAAAFLLWRRKMRKTRNHE